MCIMRAPWTIEFQVIDGFGAESQNIMFSLKRKKIWKCTIRAD